MRFELDHNHKYRELTGKTFTWLYVDHETRHPNPSVGGVHWYCLCECGNTVIPRTSDLLDGKAKSCGCWRRKRASVHAHNKQEYPPAHGLRHTRAYGRWSQTLQKCYTEKHANYRFHGAIGHTVCDLWRNSPVAFCEWYNSVTAKENEENECILLKEGATEFSSENCVILSKSELASTLRRKRIPHVDYVGMVGNRVGHIEVIEEFSIYNKTGQACLRWLCVCDCGGLLFRTSHQLMTNKRMTCGCGVQTYDWSDKYPHCVNCKGSGARYAGNGLCGRCFSGLIRDPAYMPNPRLDKPNKWALNFDKCVDCGTTERKHQTHGRCTRCKQRNTYKKRNAND